MSDAAESPETSKPKGGKGPLIMGLGLALAGGAGGYFATSAGLLDSILGRTPTVEEHDTDDHSVHFSAPASNAFLDVDPLVISLPPNSGHAHLRFTIKLDVVPEHLHEVEALMPRIMDMLNSYLRAVEVKDFEDPHILTTIRGHLLARMQVVVGSDRVRDILIQEFILS